MISLDTAKEIGAGLSQQNSSVLPQSREAVKKVSIYSRNTHVNAEVGIHIEDAIRNENK